MVRPRHEGTPYVIEVTLRPGKYELLGAQIKIHFYARERSLWLFDVEKAAPGRAAGWKKSFLAANSPLFSKY